MTGFLLGLASPIAYLIIFGLLILCGMGNPVPEDTILIAAGYISQSEVIRYYYMLPICYFGVISGDCILYLFGRKYGQKVINHPKFLKLIPVKRVDKIRKGFQKRGHWMVFFARFLVGFRSPTFLVSGVMHLPLRKFLLLDCLGALISVPLFFGLGYLFSAHVDGLRRDIHRVQSWVVAITVGLVAVFFLWRWFRSRKEDVDLDAPFLWDINNKKETGDDGSNDRIPEKDSL